MSHSIYFNFIINSDKESVYKTVSEPEHLENWWPLKCSGIPKEGEEYNFNFTDESFKSTCTFVNKTYQ